VSFDRIKQALLRKLGPLPAWAWASIGGVGLYFWRRHQAANAGAGGLPSADDVGYPGGADTYGTYPQDFGYYGTGSGGGGGGGTDDQPASPPPVYYDPATDSYATVPPDWYTTPPPWWDQSPSPDTPTPTTTAATGPSTATTPRPHPSQPLSPATNPESVYQAGGPGGSHLVQPLQWGGQLFYTQSQFAQWAAAHGSSVAAELSNHPEARAIYNQLGANPYVAATVPDLSRTKVAARTTQVVEQTPAPTITRTSTPAPAPAPKTSPAPAPAPTPEQKVVIVTSPAKATPAAQPGKRVIE